jgi:hypothetical protein
MSERYELHEQGGQWFIELLDDSIADPVIAAEVHHHGEHGYRVRLPGNGSHWSKDEMLARFIRWRQQS